MATTWPKVSVFLPPDVHQQIKLAAVHRRLSIQKVMLEAAQDWLAKGVQPPLATRALDDEWSSGG